MWGWLGVDEDGWQRLCSLAGRVVDPRICIISDLRLCRNTMSKGCNNWVLFDACGLMIEVLP